MTSMTREELHQLVWSRPTVEVARTLGLSDVGLAKRCRRLQIPTPPRGYWARVAVGQTPPRIPLPELTSTGLDDSALKFDLTPRTPAIRSVSSPESSATPPSIDFRELTAPVKRTARELKRPWIQDLTWSHGERSGPILHIDVSEPTADRTLRICDRLLTTAASHGWPFVACQPSTFGCLLVAGESISFRVQEINRREPHLVSAQEEADAAKFSFLKPPQWDLVCTGLLRLQVTAQDGPNIERAWKESRRRPLDVQIPDILAGFLEYAQRLKTRREDRERTELDSKHRQVLATALADRRRRNQDRIHQLEAQAGAWFRARLLRAYLRALKRNHPAAAPEFLAWTQHHIDQLDPLSPTPHDPDLMQDRTSFATLDDKTLSDLLRLTGHYWHEVHKPARDTFASAPQTTSREEPTRPNSCQLSSPSSNVLDGRPQIPPNTTET